MSVFETNIRFVGGFLTMYALTGETMYKDKAQEVADKLLPAFQTPTGIPHALVNIQRGVRTHIIIIYSTISTISFEYIFFFYFHLPLTV